MAEGEEDGSSSAVVSFGSFRYFPISSNSWEGTETERSGKSFGIVVGFGCSWTGGWGVDIGGGSSVEKVEGGDGKGGRWECGDCF